MLQPLQDQPARDRFITELGQNFCVSAGAGVGKTSAIVDRVAQLALRELSSLARLVVVTYTKAAAEECASARAPQCSINSAAPRIGGRLC